jgi:hypothetical protein
VYKETLRPPLGGDVEEVVERPMTFIANLH